MRHLLIIAWLFNDFNDFFRAYSKTLSVPIACSEQSTRIEKHGTIHDRCQQVVALLTAGHSAASAAAKVGVDVSTAMAWAAKSGIACARRPKMLKGQIREKLLVALQAGTDKQITASATGVSVTTVTRILRTEVGLQQHWNEARFTRAQTAAREEWATLVVANPGLGSKALRMLASAAYAWLYRNDRLWLTELHIASARIPRGASIQWDTRDEKLSQLVKEVSWELLDQSPLRRIKLWQIYERIPDLKAKLAKLDRLPLTRKAIELATRSKKTESLL